MKATAPAAQAATVVDVLAGRVAAGEAVPREEVLAALTELRATLTELQTAQQHLQERDDDIAEAHVVLAAERRRYRELFELAPDAYLVTDENGMVLEANENAVELFATPRRLLVGKPLVMHVPPEQRRDFRGVILEVKHSGEARRLHLTLRRHDGVAFYAALTVAPARREHAETVIGIRWLIRDVTEERQAEQQLWELNADLEQRVREQTAATEAHATLLAAVIEQVPLGVVVADVETGRFTIANSVARALLATSARTPGTVDELTALEAFHPDGTPYERDELPLARAIDADETVVGAVLERAMPDGRHVTLSVTAFPVLGANGGKIAAVSLFEDVSERERRRHAEREFAANASHELRTPVAAIASAIEVLQSGAKDDLVERDRFLEHIQRESNRLQRLSRALLLLARADAAGERPRVTVVPLKPLLRDVAAGTRAAPGVDLTIRCRRDLAAVAAPDLLEQAVANVLGNAVRYTERGSIAVSARAEGDWATVRVADTGRGIDRDQAQLVFGRFYRAGARDALGVGLGLAIARQAVEASGGTIALESREGAGTTVTIRLPLARMVAR